MQNMFWGCSSLISVDFKNFDTSNVTNMRYMFRSCSGLTSLDLSKFDTSKVQDMQGMFYDCSNLTSLNLSKFDTTKVRDMRVMFSGCSSLTNLDLSSFKTPEATDMACMFEKCSNLASLNISNFNTSNVTDMTCMFRYCSSLTSLNVSSFDTSNVTAMTEMFQYCSSLTSLDLSSFNMAKVTDTLNNGGNYYMFLGCVSLAEIWTPLNVPETLYVRLELGTKAFLDGAGVIHRILPTGKSESIRLRWFGAGPSPSPTAKITLVRRKISYLLFAVLISTDMLTVNLKQTAGPRFFIYPPSGYTVSSASFDNDNFTLERMEGFDGMCWRAMLTKDSQGKNIAIATTSYALNIKGKIEKKSCDSVQHCGFGRRIRRCRKAVAKGVYRRA